MSLKFLTSEGLQFPVSKAHDHLPFPAYHIISVWPSVRLGSIPVKALFVEHFTRLIKDLSFFFESKQRLKCKTYSIDKEETSIIMLKSFSYKVISTDMSVYNYYNKTNMLVQFYYFICFIHITKPSEVNGLIII